MPRPSFVATLSLLAVALAASPAAAIGLGGRGPSAGRSSTRPPALSRAGGHFDGKSYELGFYLTPLLGYESNYKVTTADVEGGVIWAVEGGIELRYRPSPRLRLRTELSTIARSPVADAGLFELLIEHPAQLVYRLSDKLELSLGNLLLIERSKTPPVFIEGAAGTTIRYGLFADILRAGLAYHLADGFFVDAGPYLQIKQVNFLENPEDSEPDYRFFDIGADLALKYRLDDLLSVRLRYDVAYRSFTNYAARPPEREPELGEALAMTRQIWGLAVASKIFGPLRARAAYSLRLNRDNGGFFNYLDHIVSGGLSVNWRERVSLESSLTHVRRSYTDRTPCEAESRPPHVGSDCLAGADPSVQDRRETMVLVNVTLGVALSDTFQLLVSYQLEDAASDIEDLLVANHRLMGGVSISL